MMCVFFVAWITARPVVLVVVPPNHAKTAPPSVSVPIVPGETLTVRL